MAGDYCGGDCYGNNSRRDKEEEIILGNTMQKEDLKQIREVVREEISDLRVDVGEIKSDISILKTDVSGLKNDTKYLGDKIDKVEDEVGYLKQLMNQVREEMHEGFNKLFKTEDEDIRAIHDDILKLTKRVTKLEKAKA